MSNVIAPMKFGVQCESTMPMSRAKPQAVAARACAIATRTIPINWPRGARRYRQLFAGLRRPDHHCELAAWRDRGGSDWAADSIVFWQPSVWYSTNDVIGVDMTPEMLAKGRGQR